MNHGASRTSLSFEDEDKNAGSLLQEFAMHYPGLSRVEILEKISKNADISVLEIPKSINPELLLDKTINLDSKTKLKLDGKKYVIRVNQEENNPVYILSKKLRHVQPLSWLRLEMATKDRHKDILPVVEEAVPMPKQLKRRHSFFGTDYEGNSTLVEEINEKLAVVSEKSLKKHKHKKKKDKSDVSTEPVEEKQELIFQIFENAAKNNEVKHKKKKGHVNSTVTSESQVPVFELDVSEIPNNHKPKKHKKSKKRKRESTESEKESVISEILDSVRAELSVSTSPKKKKKKKHQESE